MKRLLIIGAGGFGREIAVWASDVQARDQGFRVEGFLDANPSALDGFKTGLPILADPLDYKPSDQDVFVCAIGDPVQKLKICRSMKERGALFLTLLHPTAVVGPRCQIGEGCVVCPGAILTTDIELGAFVTLNILSCIGHDVVVGQGCILNPHAGVMGRARLGEGVFLGSHAVVLPGAKVGDYARVGAGSVVLNKAAARTTVMGVPARKVY